MKTKQNLKNNIFESVLINSKLRLVLFGIQCVLDIEIDPKDIDKVFRDSEEDATSAKRYTFWEDGKTNFYGEVEDYEPETIILNIISKKITSEELKRIISRAEYEVYNTQKE